MQVDSTQVIVDKARDPFKDFGSAIVGNIVSYNSSFEEEEQIKDVSQKGDEVVNIEKTVVETKVITPTSTPVTPITPSTPLALVVQVQFDEKIEAQNLISSLRKLLEKNNSIKSIENTLSSVLDKTQGIIRPVDTPTDVQ